MKRWVRERGREGGDFHRGKMKRDGLTRRGKSWFSMFPLSGMHGVGLICVEAYLPVASEEEGTKEGKSRTGWDLL